MTMAPQQAVINMRLSGYKVQIQIGSKYKLSAVCECVFSVVCVGPHADMEKPT